MEITLTKVDIYTTRIWIAHLDFIEEEYKLMKETVLKIKNENIEPRGRSNRGGWNSQPTILEHPNFSKLKQQVNKVFNIALQEMGGKNMQYRLKGWANYLPKNGYNTLHVHPGSILSSAFYLEIPEGSAEITFRDPRPGVVLGMLRDGEINSYVERRLKPKKGMLAVFPGWLDHKVDSHESDAARISIAINADPVIN